MPTYPSTPKPARISVSGEVATDVTYSHSFARIAASRGGQRWSWSLIYPPIKNEDVAWGILMWLHARGGQASVFDFSDPSYVGPRGSVSGTVTTQAAHQTNESSISMDGFVTLTNVFKAGDMLNFANHDKLYRVVSDVSSSGGSAGVTIFPPLQTDVPLGTAVNYSNPVARCSLGDDVLKVDVSTAKFYGFSTNLVEVI